MEHHPNDRPPLDRIAGRVLVVDEVGAVLLFRGRDVTRPDLAPWWFTPGGGADPGESTADAARRELREETGLVAGPLGAAVHHRSTEFVFEGQPIRQTEEFFLLRTTRFAPVADGWNDTERRSLLGHRWWEVGELAATDEVVYPERLDRLLTTLLGD